MKRIISVLLALALLACAALAEEKQAAPGERLGFALLKDLYAEGENTVLSPMSLTLALGMAAEGAEGETLAQLLSALDAEDLAALAAVPKDLRAANAVFTRPGLVLREGYIAALEEKYGPEWFEIDGNVVQKVNGWVEDCTDGLIDSLLDSAPSDAIAMLLVNAVAMDADWRNPFMSEATSEQPFHAHDGDLIVDMMRQTAWFDYAEKDGVQIIRLPYADSSLEMWAALPEADGMAALLEKLAEEGCAYLKSDAQNTEVVLSMPKLDIADSHSLAEALKAMGLTLPFGADADFSGISDVPMCIDEIIQKARIQIDEAGTKAAAATAIAMRAMAMFNPDQPEPVVMTLDRPFVLAVSDRETGGVCFAAVVEKPA